MSFMTDNNKPESTAGQEQVDAPEIETKPEEGTESKPEDKKEGAEHTENEIDYDAEIEKEKLRGKPDLEKAFEAKKKRFQKHQEDEEGEDEPDDENRPVTIRELKELEANVEARVRRDILGNQFFIEARKLSGSDKEAQLMVEKWKNRTFPSGLTLEDQVQEIYAITHAKKILGEKNEALRALKGKEQANTNAAGGHQDPPKGKEPTLAPQDAAVIKAAGFVYNSTSRRYEKKLPNGSLLVRMPDGKTTVIKAK